VARLGLVALIGTTLLVVASAAGQTREQFTQQADAICKQSNPAINRKIDKANRLANHENFDGAGRLLNRAVKSYRHALGRIAELPRPPADAAAIASWLGVKFSEARALEATARAIRREDVGKINRSIGRFENLARQADRQGKALGLHACA
jgi:hypothetical protein